MVPITLTLFLRKFHTLFRQKLFVARFGDLIKDLSFRDRDATNFISIFCYRRLFFAVLIVFVSDYPFA